MADNKMMIFENEQFGRVRIINVEGNPWFVSVDVCAALGVSRTAVRRLDEDEKGVRSTHTLGGTQKLAVVNEYGLYDLILGSRKPEAKEFKRWITHEVIPSIRKNGAYMTDAVIEHLEENPELVPEYLNHLRDENARAKELRRQLDTVTGQLAVAQPKAEYYDSFVGKDDLTCFRYTAKELGVSQKKLMGYLLENNYLFRDRHRDGRAFARAGKKNDPLFGTRDFYTPHARKSEYTLVTPAGKEHLRGLVDSIRAWSPKDTGNEISNGEKATEKAVFAE